MILGRPTNLWLGLVTAALATLQVILVQLTFDPVAVATILGALGVFAGAVIALIANQPPTVNPGDRLTITTPEGQPNYQTTVATPPAASPPPTPVPGTD